MWTAVIAVAVLFAVYSVLKPKSCANCQGCIGSCTSRGSDHERK
jgi:hypothetical protein